MFCSQHLSVLGVRCKTRLESSNKKKNSFKFMVDLAGAGAGAGKQDNLLQGRAPVGRPGHPAAEERAKRRIRTPGRRVQRRCAHRAPAHRLRGLKDAHTASARPTHWNIPPLSKSR